MHNPRGSESRKEQVSTWGTVKAAVLEGDPGCPGLVASRYSAKPVRFLGMVCSRIQWSVKGRPVFNMETGRTDILQFLRLNHGDQYNRVGWAMLEFLINCKISIDFTIG